MHILTGQTRQIDNGEEAVDLNQTPADILFLSAADTELGSFSAALSALTDVKPSLRLANILALSHPYSVDLYAEKTARASRLVIVRILGGVSYWRYGLERLAEEARSSNFDLIVIPGDDKWDEELTSWSTRSEIEVRRFWRYCVEGGTENYKNAILYAGMLVGVSAEPAHPVPLQRAGLYLPGQTNPDIKALKSHWKDLSRPVAAITFYRALLQSGQTAPIDALIRALEQNGLNVMPVFVASLKDKESVVVLDNLFDEVTPSIVLNGTAFAVSKVGGRHEATPLDRPGKVVLQVVFSSSSKEGWEESDQGLSARDLAMHVVLPEVDGRVLTRAVSFKEEDARDEQTQSNPVIFSPLSDRVNFVAELAGKWALLTRKENQTKKTALILANYPNRDGRIANGVGLDTPASCVNVLREMQANGFDTGDAPDSADGLMKMLSDGVTNALASRNKRSVFKKLSVVQYRALFDKLPSDVRKEVLERWGEPENDPHVFNGSFRLAIHQFGSQSVGIQPARGYNIDPKETYHDPALVPPHCYFAFYFFLREKFEVDAFIHLGKHGNLEWLPGKALALSENCYPEIALGPTPNIYPFIVNDPGEGSQAKRRSSAVIVDHLTPPLARAESHGIGLELEALLDEYYLASGVDQRRLKALTQDILDTAVRHGLDKDIGLHDGMDEETRLVRLDAHLCDLKELQIRDGLHILGESPTSALMSDLVSALVRVPRGESDEDQSLQRAISKDLGFDGFDPLDCDFAQPWDLPKPNILKSVNSSPWRTCGDTVERIEQLAADFVSAPEKALTQFVRTKKVLSFVKTDLEPSIKNSGPSEIQAVLNSLNGSFIAPGPSGAPSRGRPDVLPTGRNFYSVDVRAVPTETAWRLGVQSASLVALRYFQDEGEWPKALVLTCWGTANMRTGGDDIAQALAFIGAKPVWEQASGRVTGFEIVKLSELGRPRIDVTLRVSGFFRDAFPHQMDLFDSAIKAVGALDEPAEANPIAENMRSEALRLEKQGLDTGSAKQKAEARVFGSKPGAYGAGLQALIDEGIWENRSDFAEAFLEWGGYAYGGKNQGAPARTDLENRLNAVDLVVQNQDNREHDLLDSDDYYQFEGGLAATVETLKGEAPAIYHNDHSRPERPVVRTLSEEIGRVVRGRAANPKWIKGVMRHGYKGAFEMVATLDYLFSFAATTKAVGDHHFDQLYDAYLVDNNILQFLEEANLAGLHEMVDRFTEAIDRGLWSPRRNSTHASLQDLKSHLKKRASS